MLMSSFGIVCVFLLMRLWNILSFDFTPTAPLKLRFYTATGIKKTQMFHHIQSYFLCIIICILVPLKYEAEASDHNVLMQLVPFCVQAAVGCKIECSSFYDSVIGPGCKHWCCKNKCVRLALHNKHKRLCLVANRRLMLS